MRTSKWTKIKRSIAQHRQLFWIEKDCKKRFKTNNLSDGFLHSMLTINSLPEAHFIMYSLKPKIESAYGYYYFIWIGIVVSLCMCVCAREKKNRLNFAQVNMWKLLSFTHNNFCFLSFSLAPSLLLLFLVVSVASCWIENYWIINVECCVFVLILE